MCSHSIPVTTTDRANKWFGRDSALSRRNGIIGRDMALEDHSNESGALTVGTRGTDFRFIAYRLAN